MLSYISLNSQLKMLFSNIGNVILDKELVQLRGHEFKKLIFSSHFLIQDISVNKTLRNIQFRIQTDEIQMEGTVSQMFEIGLSFYFMKCRNLFFKRSTKSSRFLT